MTPRSKLIFFASTDPGTDPGPTASAYRFADVAAGADLDTEVRLAGDAVRVALSGFTPTTPGGVELVARTRAASARPVPVSL